MNNPVKMTYSQYYEYAEITLRTFKEKNDKLKADLALAIEGLEVSANQLEGVSVAIKAHGQNIDTQFFIYEYAEMAKDKREILAQLDKKEGE